MKTIARKIALAAAVAALAPAAARASEPRPKPVVRVAVPPPHAVLIVNAHQGDDDRGPDRFEDPDGWRRREPGRHAWQARERAELRAEYARLDDTRARFYAVPHHPWRVRQFEAWYAHEHAELDARWARVS